MSFRISDLVANGIVEASTLKKTGGTSSQFLKADGTVDSSAYVTGGPYLPLSGGTITGLLTVNSGYNTGNPLYVYGATSGNDAVITVQRGSGSHKGSGLYISGANYTDVGNQAFIELNANTYSGSSTRYIHAYDNSGTDFVVYGDGVVTTSGSFRAPIFYDSVNTSYYLDPNSTSNLYTVNITGGLVVTGPNAWNATTPVLNIGGSGDGRLQVRHIWGKDAGSTGTDSLWLQYGSSGNHVQIGGGGNNSNLYVQGDIYMNGYFGGNLVATQSWVNGAYLPLSGGTMTGAILSTASNQNFTNFTARNTSTAASMQDHVYYYIQARYNSGVNGTDVFHWVRSTWEYNITNTWSDITMGASSGGTSYVNLFRVSTDGQVYATNSFRAPIFYDSANSAYYVDPNSQSRMSTLWLSNGGFSGQLYIGGDSAGGRLNINSDQIWTATGSLYLQYSSSGWVYLNDGGGHTQSATSIRAPIFYDSQDTNYYLDPNSQSNVLRIKTNQSWYDNSASDWGGGINMSGNNPSIGFQPTSSSWWYMLHHSTYMNFYRRNTGGGWNQDGIWDTSGNLIWINGYMQANNSMRAPIFYDSNDTGYYLDPNSTSNLYSVNMNRAQVTNDVTSSSGMGRFGGWYQGTGYTGLATEIGISGGEGYIITYNRGTSSYGNLNFEANNIRLNGTNNSSTVDIVTYTNYKFRFLGGDVAQVYNGASTSNMYLNYFGSQVVLNGQGNGNTLIGTTSNVGYRLHVAGDIYANGGWLRVSGAAGVYWETYGGGWRMTGSSYVEMYNGKSLHMQFGSVDYVSSLYLESSGQGVHLRGNDGGSYGSLRIQDTRNGWYGIYFDSGTTLMMNSNESGNYRQGYGWQYRWYNGSMYISTNSYGGGSEYTVLHSGNYNSYSPTLTGGGASGTWGINITGNAETANSLTYYSASPYQWTGSQVLYYWTKIANISNVGDAQFTIEISVKTDVNYIPYVLALASISSWNNTTQSIKLDALSSLDREIRIAVDNSGDVWIYAQAEWSSYLRWRVKDKLGSPTIYTSGFTQTTSQPANSTYITCGQNMRGNQGSMSSASVGNSENRVGVLSALGAVYATIYYDRDDTNYYVNPGSTSRLVQLNLGTANTALTSNDATGYVKIYGTSGNYLGIGPYNNNGWVYFENISNGNGIYFNSPGRYAFDNVDLTPYNDAENSLGNGSYRWSQVYTSGWLRQYGAQGMYNQDYGTHFYSNSGNSWGITGSGGDIYLQFRSTHQSTLRGYVHANTANEIGFLSEDGNWVLRTWNRGVHAYGSMRAPIFYDSDDTGYYLDPNSTSRLYTLRIQNVIDFPTSAGGSTSRGSNAYAIYQEAGGWSWPYPDLCIAFHTGISFGANPSYQGMRFFDDYTLSTQVMSINNGSDPLGANNVYVNNSLQAGSSLRAPIFYDSDNTGYYLDPASTSNLNILSIASYQYVGGQTTNGQSHFQWYPSNFYPPSSYTTRFLIRQDNSYTGLQDAIPALTLFNGNGGNQTTVQLAFASPEGATFGGNSVALAGIIAKKEAAGNIGGWSPGSLTFYVKDYSTRRDALYIDTSGYVYTPYSFRAPIFYDSDNTGYYLDPASTSNLNVLTLAGTITSGGNIFINNASPTIFLQDTDHRSSMIHCNSNIFYVLRGSGNNSTSWATYNGYWPLEINLDNNNASFGGTVSAVYDFRAPIFYDSNDTTYYADFANSGRSMYTAGYLQSDRLIMKGSSGGGQIYPTIAYGGVSVYGGDSLTNGAWVTVTGLSYGSSPGAGSAEIVVRTAATSKFNVFSYDGSTYTARWAIFGSSGNMTVGNNTDYGYRLYVDGTIYATGNVIAYSDSRVKTNVREIENPLDRVLKSRGVIYDRIDTEDKNQVGFIAQELEEQFPELVETSNDGRKGVMYQNMVAVLLEAVKEQQKQIDKLKMLIDGAA